MRSFAGRPDRRIALAAAAAVALAFWGPAAGHEAHRAKSAPRAVSKADSSADSSADSTASPAPAPAPPEAGEPAFEMPPMGDMLVHHLHNKLIHLPIVLTPVALALLLLERRRPGGGGVAPIFVWGAALSGVAAFFTGRSQAGVFDDGPKEWLVATHQAWGTALLVVLVVWAGLVAWPAARRHAWIAGAIATMLMAVAALYGGLVAHG